MRLLLVFLFVALPLFPYTMTTTVDIFASRGVAGTTGTPGEQALPLVRGTIVLPPGSDLTTLTVRLENPVIEEGLRADYPVTGPIRVLDGSYPAVKNIPRDPNGFFPAAWVEVTSTGYAGSLPLATVTVNTHRIHQGVISKLTGGTLIISCGDGHKTDFRTPAAARRLIDRAINAEEAHKWFPLRDETRHLLILTSNSAFGSTAMLPSYILALRASGWTVTPVGVESFASDVTGQERAFRIREYIKLRAAEGVTHVLLIGDPHHALGNLPMRLTYPLAGDPSHTVPTDHYFADLNGNWDLNGDGYEGMFSMDTGPGGVDLYPEVIVGRIPVYRNNWEQLDSYLRRLLHFRSVAQPVERTFLLPNSIPFLPNEYGENEPMTDGAELGEEFTRYILDPLGIPYIKMYEAEGISPSPYECDFPITEENVVAAWKMGAAGVLYYGHGGQESVVRTTWAFDDGDGRPEAENGEIVAYQFFASYLSWDINPKLPSYAFAVACNNGTPENENNLAASMLRTGAIGTFGATRWAAVYGSETNFIEHNSASGIGYRTMMNLVQGEMDAGSAVLMAKADPNAILDHSYWMANIFDYNLYGDPTTNYYGGDLNADFPEPGVFWCRVEPDQVPPCDQEISLVLKGSGDDLPFSLGEPAASNRALKPAAVSLVSVSEEADDIYNVTLSISTSRSLSESFQLPVTLGNTTLQIPIRIAPERLTDETGNYTGHPDITFVDIVETGIRIDGEEVIFDLSVATTLPPPSFFSGDSYYAGIWWLNVSSDRWIDMSVRFYQHKGAEYALLVSEPDTTILAEVPFTREGNHLSVSIPGSYILPYGSSFCSLGATYASFDNRQYGDSYQEMDGWTCICLQSEPPPEAQLLSGLALPEQANR